MVKIKISMLQVWLALFALCTVLAQADFQNAQFQYNRAQWEAGRDAHRPPGYARPPVSRHAPPAFPPPPASGISCTQSTNIVSSRLSDSVFVRAVTNAIAAGCANTQTWTGGSNVWGVPVIPNNTASGNSTELNSALERAKQIRRPATGIYQQMKASFKGWGMVYAKAIASATISCTNKNSSYECRTADAVSTALAQSRANFIASATAKAFNRCGQCGMTAEAKATLSAQLLLQLDVVATAQVNSTVCVGPNSTASASGYAKCYGLIIAKGFAQSIAMAMIEGDCFSDKAATAQVKAEVQADIKIRLCACHFWTYADAQGDNAFAQSEVSGQCDTYVTQLPTPDAPADGDD